MENLTAKEKEELNIAIVDLEIVKESCQEGYDGKWDCSTDEGKEGFIDMINLLERIEKTIKKFTTNNS